MEEHDFVGQEKDGLIIIVYLACFGPGSVCGNARPKKLCINAQQDIFSVAGRQITVSGDHLYLSMHFLYASSSRDHSDYAMKQFAFSPKSFNKTMSIVDKTLKMPNSIGFDNEADMEKFLKDDEKGRRVGFLFKLEDNILKVTIRYNTKATKTNWQVTDTYNTPRIGIHSRESSMGNPVTPGYYMHGFVFLQNAIFEALHGKPNRTIYLNRLPVKASEEDSFNSLVFKYAFLFGVLFYASMNTSLMVSGVGKKENNGKFFKFRLGNKYR